MSDHKNEFSSADDRIDELMRDYHEVDEPLTEEQRERMWRAIAERRHGDRSRISRVAPVSRWRRMLWPVAAAALLLLGVSIGRNLTSTRSGHAPDLVDSAPRWRQETAEAFYRLAARDYLRRTETQLVRYRQDGAPAADSPDAPVTDWAGALLVQTRLLLDSPAAEDPGFHDLLEDLEVVLARLVQAGAETSELDQDWILEGLERQDILRRLRQELPSDEPNSQPAVRT